MVQALKIRIFKKPLEIHEKLATEATQLQQKVPRETRQPDVAENVPGHGEGSRGGVKAKDAASSYEPSLDGSPALSPVQDRDEDAPRDEDVGATGRTRSRSAGPVPEGFREGDGGGPLEQCAISGASSSRVIDTVGAWRGALSSSRVPHRPEDQGVRQTLQIQGVGRPKRWRKRERSPERREGKRKRKERPRQGGEVSERWPLPSPARGVLDQGTARPDDERAAPWPPDEVGIPVPGQATRRTRSCRGWCCCRRERVGRQTTQGHRGPTHLAHQDKRGSALLQEFAGRGWAGWPACRGAELRVPWREEGPGEWNSEWSAAYCTGRTSWRKSREYRSPNVYKRIRFDYAGEMVAIMEDLEADKVIACWPKIGEAGIQPAERFVSEEVKEWLQKPRSTLLPRCYWPAKPPKSRVRASDEEWEKLVSAAAARNMMREVQEEDILRDHESNLVLNGAGAVPKYKCVDGREVRLQRFISVLVPSNTYQDHMAGDDKHLPYLGQLAMVEVEPEQEVLVDSEDLTSCFNLFTLPEEWGGLMTFAKQVPSSVFGGSPDQKSWVAMNVVRMGWINSVSLMQTVVRQLVFVESKIPCSSEISKMKSFPEEPSASLVYLDSYDEIRKIESSYSDLLEGEESERHKQFAATCKKFGLSLNIGKRLVGAIKGSLQGGTLDGRKGVFHSAPEKQASLICSWARSKSQNLSCGTSLGKLCSISPLGGRRWASSKPSSMTSRHWAELVRLGTWVPRQGTRFSWWWRWPPCCEWTWGQPSTRRWPSPTRHPSAPEEA